MTAETDKRNGIVDPSVNVKALNEAANRRQDDLRLSSAALNDAKIEHQKEIGEVRYHMQEKMRELSERHRHSQSIAEAQRLDSIRQVDREDVAKTAAAAQQAIATLASQTSALAETLRTQVATVAQAAENRQSAFASDVNKRLQALELSSSEGKGKQAVADPAMERLAQNVEALVKLQASGSGKSEGSKAMWGYALGGAGLVLTLASIVAIVVKLT